MVGTLYAYASVVPCPHVGSGPHVAYRGTAMVQKRYAGYFWHKYLYTDSVSLQHPYNTHHLSNSSESSSFNR